MCFSSLQPSNALVHVLSLLTEVEVELVPQGDFVITARNSHSRRIGFVRITDVKPMKEESEEQRYAILRCIVQPAVNQLSALVVLHPHRGVRTKVRAVVAQHDRGHQR